MNFMPISAKEVHLQADDVGYTGSFGALTGFNFNVRQLGYSDYVSFRSMLLNDQLRCSISSADFLNVGLRGLDNVGGQCSAHRSVRRPGAGLGWYLLAIFDGL
jgi:hypothetical protein